MENLDGTHSYEYDPLYRLTEVTYPDQATDSYTYDAVGNRLTKDTDDYTYDAADQLTDLEGTSFDYDDNGNQTERGSDTFGYDHENRLTESVIDSVTSTSVYNGDGLRMSHTVDQTTTSYIWDVASGLPVVLQDGTNTYVYGLDLISATDDQDAQTYFTYDGLGSTANLTDDQGDVVDDYSYDVFGAVRSQSGSSENYWLFTGEQEDSDSGLYYLRARYYDPEVGRFLGRDPLRGSIALPDSMNRYVYVTNSPVIFVDPYGYFGFGDIAKGAKKVGGGIVKGAKAVGDAIDSAADCATDYRCSQRWSHQFDWWAAQLQNAAAATSNTIAVAGCAGGAAVSAGTMTWAGCLLGKGLGEVLTGPIDFASNVASVAGSALDCSGRFLDQKEGGGFTLRNFGKCGTSAAVTGAGFFWEDTINAGLADYQLYCRDEGKCGKWASW